MAPKKPLCSATQLPSLLPLSPNRYFPARRRTFVHQVRQHRSNPGEVGKEVILQVPSQGPSQLQQRLQAEGCPQPQWAEQDVQQLPLVVQQLWERLAEGRERCRRAQPVLC